MPLYVFDNFDHSSWYQYLSQEHSVVLVRVGRLKDVPGVKSRCVRGKYDLPHVVKKKEAAAKK